MHIFLYLFSDAHSVRSEKSRIPPAKHYERIGGPESGQRVPPATTSPADAQACGDPDYVQSIAGSTMLQFAKTRKLSIERSDLRKYARIFCFRSIHLFLDFHLTTYGSCFDVSVLVV